MLPRWKWEGECLRRYILKPRHPWETAGGMHRSPTELLLAQHREELSLVHTDIMSVKQAL